MWLRFVRIEEMANKDLSVSIIDDEEHTAAIFIPPKQSKNRERYDVRRTEDLRVCPTETFFVWLTRLREHFQQSPTNIIHLFWTEKWEQADQKYISICLERLAQTLGEQNASANSIRYASSTDPAAQESKIPKHLHSQRITVRSKLLKLSQNKGGGARVSEGDVLQQSPLGDNLQLSPQETLASSLFPPIISTKPIVEAESPNDHESEKAQKSQMQKDDQDVEPQEEAHNSSTELNDYLKEFKTKNLTQNCISRKKSYRYNGTQEISQIGEIEKQ
ncbi:MAG: hypothetical protein EZS28_016225 [Streblomastix strix]|uniref:Uncharacterized protein n=1 Tax=Streblomastix strix TaxID=222440 RepID=A0A5J4W0U9_9EUKA|nr:MAG: hypothetical protein EZS28_016225 [Streblomastix strix]